MKKIFILLIALLAISAVYATTYRITSISPEIVEEIQDNPHLFYYDIAKMHFNEQKYEKSIELFTKAISFDDSFAPAYHDLGVAYYSINEHSKAEYNLVIATRINPEYSKAYYSLGLLYFENNKFDAAIESFKQALKYDKDNPNKNFDLAQSYVAKYRSNEKAGSFQDLKTALKLLIRTLQLDPNFANAQNNIDIIEDILQSRFQDLAPQS